MVPTRSARGKHSGRECSPLPSRSRFFELLDAVAQAGSFFVVLASDGLFEAVAQLGQLRLGLFGLRIAARRLADVPGLAVNVLQQRQEILAERGVVQRTAEPARVAEV